MPGSGRASWSPTPRADLLSTVVQEGSFRKVDDGLFVQIGERLPDGRLGGIFVADSRTQGSTSSTTPSTGWCSTATGRTCS